MQVQDGGSRPVVCAKTRILRTSTADGKQLKSSTTYCPHSYHVRTFECLLKEFRTNFSWEPIAKMKRGKEQTRCFRAC